MTCPRLAPRAIGGTSWCAQDPRWAVPRCGDPGRGAKTMCVYAEAWLAAHGFACVLSAAYLRLLGASGCREVIVECIRWSHSEVDRVWLPAGLAALADYERVFRNVRVEPRALVEAALTSHGARALVAMRALGATDADVASAFACGALAPP